MKISIACMRQAQASSLGALVLSAAVLATASIAAAGVQESYAIQAESTLDGHQLRLDGRVLMPDGLPASGAIVVSSAGGSVATDQDGSFALDLVVGSEVLVVELTAVANGQRGALTSHHQAHLLREGSSVHTGTLVLTESTGCASEWIPTFGRQPGTSGDVHALAVFDDGSGFGPMLFAGGTFLSAGGMSARRVARWDGQEWTSLGAGIQGSTVCDVLALVAFDDGSGGGPALYAAGEFSAAGGLSASNVAKWDGKAWSSLGSGVEGSGAVRVNALAVFDDGSGPALYAGGQFDVAGGLPANNIAKWGGGVWSTLGGGINELTAGNPVRALAVYDDGSGPALYVGGHFIAAGGMFGANHIARWDGTNWSALGGGTNGEVNALIACDLGSGAALYAAGEFKSPAQNIARWDGHAWESLSSGTNGTVHALAVAKVGSGAGPLLYAAGDFTTAGAQDARRIAGWDGQGWSALGNGMDNTVRALTAFDDGSAPDARLVVGGLFLGAIDQPGRWITQWDGESWGVIGTGPNDRFAALTIFDDGSGPALYAGGYFLSAGGKNLGRIAKRDGQDWVPLGGGVDGPQYQPFTFIPYDPGVTALAVFDDGSGYGPELYAGGHFTSAGGQPATCIAKWDGSTWSALGTGLGVPELPELVLVSALAVFDDGSGAGPGLYVGGYFGSAGGQGASNIARWDSRGWSPLGSGLSDWVMALAVFDDGAGSALYAGGRFPSAGGVSASSVAKWDGQSWSALGVGMNHPVHTLAAFADESGPALYAGGDFTLAGGHLANYIARWDGQAWSMPGTGVFSPIPSLTGVHTLTAFDDGSGPALYVGGDFTSAGGLSAKNIARWDGRVWSSVGNGVNDKVLVLAGLDDGAGAGAALYAGGSFELSPGGDSFLARWDCPTIEISSGCFGNLAVLDALSTGAVLGDTFDVSLSSSGISTGLGLVYVGTDGSDASGCGLPVPGVGELLLDLAPPPFALGAGALSAGSIGFSFPVPVASALVGAEIGLQGVVVGVSNPLGPLELSNGLLVTITQ